MEGRSDTGEGTRKAGAGAGAGEEEEEEEGGLKTDTASPLSSLSLFFASSLTYISLGTRRYVILYNNYMYVYTVNNYAPACMIALSYMYIPYRSRLLIIRFLF